ncbi:MAG TPA: methyl-accepting chemotaxis protein [Bryobacteraceae bacterium]|nr:methyl-accepting chemotaxis protein [Bryobacteraceae bacterium]
MKTSSLTLGQKLSISISGMLLMLVVLAATSLYSISSLGAEFDRAASKNAKKLHLAGLLATRSSEMLSLERGVLVRLAMKDLSKAESYHNSFDQVAKSLGDMVAEYRPLSITEQGKHDLDVMQNDVALWLPAHQDLWRKGSSGHLDDALMIYDKQTLALAKEMQKTADDLQEITLKVFAESVENANSKVALTFWVEIGLCCVFVVIGAGIVWVVRSASSKLQHMAGELGESAAQISSAAAQVASASQSLAQGASEQASSLEETSASTEEITAMTRKNAESSRNAVEVMHTVDQNIKEGNRTIQEMVVSMQEIKDSSGKISKIIKVIDEIAFQTNILALNAAVEAARAGVAGMGFAVVADEVRNLAQRSAQAAKDTASLIEDSIAKSTEGNAKLQRVTAVIGAITESSLQVKAQVDDVNLGSQEQARGIEQIAKAVEHINQVTQTTAAGAEESASAGEELSAQAVALREIVEQMRTMVGGEVSARF